MPITPNTESTERQPCSHCNTSTYLNEAGNCEYCGTHCSNCGGYYSYYNDNDGRCPECYETCQSCGCGRLRTRMVDTEEHGRLCERCARRYATCEVCGYSANVDNGLIVRLPDNTALCCNRGTDHDAEYCYGCSAWHRGPCTVVRLGAPRNVGGYHHTRPSMWLGGPLPRNERGQQIGYYVGFELEITSATRDDALAIAEWSEKRLGTNMFDCKTDSSVHGFEIATQPMTPEFFERVPWESFFEMLNSNFQLPEIADEPDSHGLHVHIGKVAFRSDVNIAAFAYLLTQGNHLERIGRRQPTRYCPKVEKPVTGIALRKSTMQGQRLMRNGASGFGRDAINLGNESTIEVRAFKSTRSAENLRSAVRTVYLAADYIRYLSTEAKVARTKALHWSEFCKWVAVNKPEAFAAISGLNSDVAINQAALEALNDEAADLLAQPINYTF